MSLPRAVFLSPTLPARTGNGLAMRMGLFLEALCSFAEVDVIVASMVDGATWSTASNFLQQLGVRLHIIPTCGVVETPFALLKRIPDPKSQLAAFRTYGKPSLASKLSSPVMAAIGEIIESCSPDLIHVGRAYLAESVSVLNSRVVATLDLDEDDRSSYASLASLARQNGRYNNADWLDQEGYACDSLVSRFGRRFERIFVASEREALLLSSRHLDLKFDCVENAVDIPLRVIRRDDAVTFLFVGSLGYVPNSEGVLWFVRNILPRLRAIDGSACRILIAGAQPTDAISALARYPRVFVLGPVPDVSRLYQYATLALAPMRAGGGTRIKLLEAAAHRVASVSTPVAAEGIGWRGDAGGWRAGSAEEFARACSEGLSNKTERDRRARLGLEWIRRYHARPKLLSRISGKMKRALLSTRYFGKDWRQQRGCLALG